MRKMFLAKRKNKTRDSRHDKSEVFSNHMAQVQACDCTRARRSPLEEGCSLFCVHTNHLL